jgi:hypothetical protein
MAEQATTVADAGKVIAGLMSGETKPEEAQATEEVVEQETSTVDEPQESQEEETVNPSDVPYMDNELEQEATEDIDESSEEPAYTVKVDGNEMAL